MGLGLLHHAFLIEVGKHQPLVLIEGVARGIDDGAAVNPAEAGVRVQPEPFEHGGEVPGVDQHPVDGGLAAHRVEPGAVEEGRPQGVADQRLVEPGDRGRRRGERAGERGARVGSAREQRVEHWFLRPTPRATCAPQAAAPAGATRPRINRLVLRLTTSGQKCKLARLNQKPAEIRPLPRWSCRPMSHKLGCGT